MADTTATPQTTERAVRKAFNWQFIGIDPESTPGVKDWTVEQVADWLEQVNLNDVTPAFVCEDINGKAMLELSQEDLTELGVTADNSKAFLTAKELLLQQEAKKTVGGVVIPKGFLPQAPPLSEETRQQVKDKVYDPLVRGWVPRDVPLSDEELECWDYQMKWLMCPISRKKWSDPDAVLGLGLYHAPRFLSKQELQRAIDDEASATIAKQKKKSEKVETTKQTEVVTWSRDFNVYPAVVPPPMEALTMDEDVKELLKNPLDVPLGPMQVIIGPAFDMMSYNDGICGNIAKGGSIKPQKERGVLKMDQQYNAFNFVYYSLRARIGDEDSFERKICTSRLSFFIEESHGSRVFPINIEGQISLFTFRDNRLSQKNTAQSYYKTEAERIKYLAFAIRKMIPRVLRTTIMEVVNGRATALDDLIDYSLRTYLLVHQVSIKLVLYYRRAFEVLYSSVMVWIKNPFAPQNNKEWPDIEDLLIAASLVGISWDVLRVAFVKRLVWIMAAQAGGRENISKRQWVERLFPQNKGLILRVLYELSFFFTSSEKTLAELDRAYSRCAGSLPKTQREALKKMVMDVEKVTTIHEFWLTMGMAEPSLSEDELIEHIGDFALDVTSNADKWAEEKVDEADFVIPPTSFLPNTKSAAAAALNTSSYTSSSAPTYTTTTTSSSSYSAPPPKVKARKELVLKSEWNKAATEEAAAEKAKHAGFPPLNSGKRLDPFTCNYPECGKKFANRDSLFRHLNKMIPKERMIRGYHQSHFALRLTDDYPYALTCAACNETFPTEEAIIAHYVSKGVKI